MSLQQRADEIAQTLKVLAPVGIDWVFVAWDGVGEVATASSVPHERLGEILLQLRGGTQHDNGSDDVVVCPRCGRSDLFEESGRIVAHSLPDGSGACQADDDDGRRW